MDPYAQEEEKEVEAPVVETKPYKPPASKKGLFIFLLFVIISLVIGFLVGGYYLGNSSSKKKVTTDVQATPTPTPDPTLSWYTYGDQQSGFSIKYPPEIGFQKDPNGQNAVVFSPGGKTWDKVNDITKRSIFIWVIDNPNSLTAEAYWQKEIAENRQPNEPIEKYELKNYDAIKVKDRSLDSIRLTSLVVSGNQKIYYLYFAEHPQANITETIADETFASMLRTFTLVGVGQSVDTTSWSTFSNPDGGYTVKYPPQWSQSYTGVVAEKNPRTVSFYDTRNTSKDLLFNGKTETVFYAYINYYENQTNLDEFVKSRISGIEKADTDRTTFNGIPAQEVYTKGGEQSPGDIAIYFIYNNTGYELKYLFVKDNYRSVMQANPDIFSTFKFTK